MELLIKAGCRLRFLSLNDVQHFPEKNKSITEMFGQRDARTEQQQLVQKQDYLFSLVQIKHSVSNPSSIQLWKESISNKINRGNNDIKINIIH